MHVLTVLQLPWLWYGGLGLVLGVLGVSYFPEWWWGGLLGFGLLLAAVGQHAFRHGLGVLFVVPGLLWGGYLYQRADHFWTTLPESISFHGQAVVRTVAEPTARGQVYVLYPVASEEVPSGVAIRWQTSILTDLRIGDTVGLSCTLTRPANFRPDFDYTRYLASQGVGYVCDRGEFTLVPPEGYSLLRVLGSVRTYVVDTVRYYLPEPMAGLALGMTLGGNDFLSDETRYTFTRVGLAHIVAVSGYNMTIIVQYLVLIGVAVGLWRRQAVVVALVGVVFFLLLIGAPPAALRAGVMAALVSVALLSGRLSTPLYALGIAAAGMLWHDPHLARYDIGFQLSFLATLGIVLLAPLREALLGTGSMWKRLTLEPLLITLSVEIWILPLLLWYFHLFSPISLLSNILVPILIPPAMLCVFLVLLLGWWGALGWVAMVPAYAVLSALVAVAGILADFPGAGIATTPPSLTFFVLWYTGAVLLTYYATRKLRHYRLAVRHNSLALPL